ncbi:hypothetical protein BBH99_17040 [Chryseobacterium contaminans]|uniref:Uncharacterized protein n=1 Tax=Chryseobacterium contaminans TaxID=1423959 RepID=A0A1M7H0U7_9FLAO|nr:hypothetical protein [Chryseobacterium contaminans]OCA80022.1 hypothetical protein BBH99_17040 [Chryseobacterium contaminans]SHM21966.1 hypothetical protein SAMN05444407_11130 [Chryseobacterium contaminans]
MKKNFTPKEKHPLPLIYDYMEIVKNREKEKTAINTTLVSEKYQTDFYAKSKPYKFLVRFL